jgi:hypothetical protein
MGQYSMSFILHSGWHQIWLRISGHKPDRHILRETLDRTHTARGFPDWRKPCVSGCGWITLPLQQLCHNEWDHKTSTSMPSISPPTACYPRLAPIALPFVQIHLMQMYNKWYRCTQVTAVPNRSISVASLPLYLPELVAKIMLY